MSRALVEPLSVEHRGAAALPPAALGGLIDRLKTAAWVFDIDHGRVVWANAAALVVWSAKSAEDLARRDMKADMSPAVARRLQQHQQDFARGPCVFNEAWTIYPGGVPRNLRVFFSGIELADGRMAMFCEAHDELSQEPEALRSADALLHTQMMISLYSGEGDALYRNPAARSALSSHGGALRARFVDDGDYHDVMGELQSAGEVSRILRVHTPGGIRWHEFTARGCHDAVSGQPALLVSEADVSDLKETEAKANFVAYHDVLTGLPNRHSVSRNFADRIASAQRSGVTLGVFFLDLDHFKLINDSLGHAFGDEVLVEVAQRLVSIGGGRDCVIRLGGDEFLLIASGASTAMFDRKAERILEVLATPIEIGDRRLTVTPSIGISLFPDDGEDAATLMKSADLAMYDAKGAGRNCHRFFTPRMRERADSRLELESSIKAAIASGEFEVYYQPRVSTRDVCIVGAEALVRWNHPRNGLVPPAHFIPICEETGLIDDLGQFVLKSAMRQQRRWSEMGHQIAVSVNVSQRQLTGTGFADLVETAIAETGCDPNLIELELTESMLMEKTEGATALVDGFRQLGLRVSVDDFGTGYSNLARLQEFAIDCVKIDRGFVKDLPQKKGFADIIIAMCKLMRVKIVAEGVETLEQLVWLRGRGCEEFQGFYFSKPVPAAAFDSLLAEQAGRAQPAPRLARRRAQPTRVLQTSAAK